MSQREADSLYQPVNRIGRAVSACTVWWFEAKPPWRTSSSLCCCHSHISAGHKQIQFKWRNEGGLQKCSNTAMTQELFQLCRVKTQLTHSLWVLGPDSAGRSCRYPPHCGRLDSDEPAAQMCALRCPFATYINRGILGRIIINFDGLFVKII